MKGLHAAAAALVVLFGLWAGIRMYSSGRHPLSAGAAVHVPVGEASPPSASDFGPETETAGPRATVPEHLPDFALHDRNGNLAPVSAWAGKSLVLNFWATWCAPCRREIPLLEALDREWAPHDVVIVGIAVDYRDKVIAYANELKIRYPLLIGEQDALDLAAKFGVDAPVFPFTVFTDRHGEVVTLYVGELHRPQADLILSVLQSLDQNRVQLAEARRSIALGLRALQPG